MRHDVSGTERRRQRQLVRLSPGDDPAVDDDLSAAVRHARPLHRTKAELLVDEESHCERTCGGLPSRKWASLINVLRQRGELARLRRSAQLRAHGAGTTKLTNAEEACLLKASHGLTYKEIAVELGCLPSTVDTHLKSVRQKLKSSSTRAAARLYFGAGTLPRSSGPEPFGSDDRPDKTAPEAHQPSPVAVEPDPPPGIAQPIGMALQRDEADDLTPWQKTARIAAIAIGAAVAAGATLPGTLLLLHALQTLHGSR